MTIRLTALVEFAPGGRRVKKGQEFTVAGESEARVLVAINKAARVTEPRPALRGTVKNFSEVAPKGADTGYRTRALEMARTAADAAHSSAAVAAASAAEPAFVIVVDGADVVLDAMEASDLHALAERLAVKVHHLAGAKKVREALMKAHGK